MFRIVSCILFVILTSAISLRAQSSDATVSAGITQNVVASLDMTPEQEKRMGNALALLEKVEQTKSYISSLVEIVRDNSISLPVGLKSKDYTICIEEMYNDEEQRLYIKAVCVIPMGNNDVIAFEGIAMIEGENGVGTHGKLELIAPKKKKLGHGSSLIFREGSLLHFGCNGFQEVDASIAFVLDSANIYVTRTGNEDLGALTFATKVKFSNLDDFTVALNIEEKFAIKGLEGFVFNISNITLDHSIHSTPVSANFPSNYFGGADAEMSRNNWQGLAIARASVTLPEYMSREDNGRKERTTLQLENVLIDGNGFSGSAEAREVISDGSIDPQSWAISVNDFLLEIHKGIISQVGFRGKVNIPPLGKSSMLDYSANYDIERRKFVLMSSLGKTLDFPMLCAKLSLDNTTRVSLSLGSDGIYPTINANGILSVDAPISKDTINSKLKLPSLRFENMIISREKFDLGTVSLNGEMETPSMAGFKLTLSEISSFKKGDGQGIHVDAALDIHEIFNSRTGINLYGDDRTWRFKKVDVDKVHISSNSEVFSVDGTVVFADGDEIYGKGFRGDIKFNLIKKFEIAAVGVFGRKDGYKYFLTDMLYMTTPAAGIQVPPALSFYGFGGGMYNHMQQNMGNPSSSFGETLSGINYVPDKNIGMGFLARTKFCLTGSPTLFDADVNFEMQFSNSWGLKFIQLRGLAKMLGREQQSSIIDGMKGMLAGAKTKSGDIIQYDERYLDTKPASKEALTAMLGMKYDLDNDVFTADMKAYLDVAGVLTGSGPDNSVGRASAYFSKDKWYTYVGTSEEKVGLDLKLGSVKLATAQGYFMVGDGIKGLSPLPEQVRSQLSPSQVSKLENRTDAGLLGAGKGLAFGADLKLDLDAKLIPFYAQLGIGMGTEMLLKKMPNLAHCEGMSGSIGVNGWYAEAQAWAWVHAAIGMRVKLFKKERKFDIINGDMAAFLKGAGPNPMYFTGAVGGSFKLLGGLIKGHCNFDFEIGDKCKIIGGSPFGEDVIAQLTPADRTSDVNVFVSPQLVLNIPANEQMTIEEENGKRETYKVGISDFTVKEKGGKIIQFTVTSSEDKRVWTYDTEKPLESKTEYSIYAKVTFERWDGKKWVSVMGEDGKPYYEDKTITFTSGERPDHIEAKHIKYAYPANRQYNFLTKEYGEAYVLVSKDYGYLFESKNHEGFDQEVQFTTLEGDQIKVPFKYRNVSDIKDVAFEIDIPIGGVNLEKNKIYNMALVNVPRKIVEKDANIQDKVGKIAEEIKGGDITETKHEAHGNLEELEQTEIYSIDFRTSSYETFVEKMGRMSVGKIITLPKYTYVYKLINNISDNTPLAEIFDEYEYGNVDYKKRLVQFEVDYSTMEWYKKYVAPIMYENAELMRYVGNIVPPSQPEIVTMEFRSTSLPHLEDEMIQSNSRANKSRYGAITNNVFEYIDQDRRSYRTIIANMSICDANMQKLSSFVSWSNIPTLTFGHYPYKIKYVLPGKNIVTSKFNINALYDEK